MSYKKLDIKNWSRKEHFNFFKTFDEPFFGVTFNVEVTALYSYCKNNNLSFFISYLYAALKAANSVENFKYRIKDDNEVRVYDVINGSPTINRPDGTFGFSYINYSDDFLTFYNNAEEEINRVRSEKTLVPSSDDDNTIHFSALPWVQFTALTHARKYGYVDSVPKISFGKVFTQDNKLFMPTSVHANHAVVDGYHVGLFSNRFQENINALTEFKTAKSNDV